MYATLATVKVSGFVAKRVGKLSKGVSNYLAKQVSLVIFRNIVLLIFFEGYNEISDPNIRVFSYFLRYSWRTQWYPQPEEDQGSNRK